MATTPVGQKPEQAPVLAPKFQGKAGPDSITIDFSRYPKSAKDCVLNVEKPMSNFVKTPQDKETCGILRNKIYFSGQ